MCEQSQSDYKALTTDEERRSYLCQFVLDPDIVKTTGFNKTTAFDESARRAEEMWWTREELGGPKGLNSMANADILIKSGTLESRPHERAALAAAGVVQYQWAETKTEKSTGYRDEASTYGEVELKSDEYKQVQRHIVSSLDDGTRKRGRPPTKPKAEESPAEKNASAVRTQQGRRRSASSNSSPTRATTKSRLAKGTCLCWKGADIRRRWSLSW